MTLQKRLQERKYGLKSFWFGSGFIYARINLNQYIMETVGWAKEQGSLERFSFHQPVYEHRI